jgi:ABC-type phosphate transport system permease subunit
LNRRWIAVVIGAVPLARWAWRSILTEFAPRRDPAAGTRSWMELLAARSRSVVYGLWGPSLVLVALCFP